MPGFRSLLLMNQVSNLGFLNFRVKKLFIYLVDCSLRLAKAQKLLGLDFLGYTFDLSFIWTVKIQFATVSMQQSQPKPVGNIMW